VTKLKSSVLRGGKPSFTVSPDSKMDSDITRSFVTDIAFSILVNFADECAEEDVESSRRKVFMHCRRCRVEFRAPIRPNLPLQKTLLLIPPLDRLSGRGVEPGLGHSHTWQSPLTLQGQTSVTWRPP
jgi:hypothetical protein